MNLKKEIGIEENVDNEIPKKKQINGLQDLDIDDNQTLFHYNKKMLKEENSSKKAMIISLSVGLIAIVLAIILYFVAGLVASIVTGLISIIPFGIAKVSYDIKKSYYPKYKKCSCGSIDMYAVADFTDIKNFKSLKQIEYWICRDCMKKYENPVYDPKYRQ